MVCFLTRRHVGFTLIELVACLVIVGILLGLVCVGLGRARETARENQCRSNLKQLGLAVHLYSGRTRTLPWFGGTKDDPSAGPFLQIYQDISENIAPVVKRRIRTLPPFLPELASPVLICPSDGEDVLSYRFCAGSSVGFEPYLEIEGIGDGPIVGLTRPTRFKDISDGLAYTALSSERLAGTGFRDGARSIAIGPFYSRLCVDRSNFSCALEFVNEAWDQLPTFDFGGHDWTRTGWGVAAYTHLVPPGFKRSCFLNGDDSGIQYGIVSATSNHASKVHVGMLDGSVESIANQIDMKIWKAKGTRASLD